MTRPARVVVLGGGIAGLAAAYFAAERGAGVSLVEEAPRLGGKIVTERAGGGFLIEGGPDSFLAHAKPWARALCERLGLGPKLLVPPRGLATNVLWRGRLRRLPEGFLGLVPETLRGLFFGSDLLTLRGKARLALEPLVRARPPPDGGDESLGAFVRRRLGREALARIAEPLLAGIYAADADRLSLLATFPRLRELERTHGSLAAGVRAERRAAHASARAPTVENENENERGRGPRSPFVSLEGGMATLVDALAARLARAGATVLTGERARAIEPSGSSVASPPRAPSRAAAGSAGCGPPDGGPGAYRVRLASGRSLDADAVVLALPAFAAAEVLRPIERAAEAASILGAIVHVSTAVVTLAFAPGAIERALDGETGFVVPRAEGRPLVACTFTSSKWPDRAPAGSALLRCFFGRAGDQAALDRPDDALVRLAASELRPVLGVRADPVLACVHRWPRAMPQYAVSHLDRVARAEAALAERHPRLVLAGAAYRGIGLPDCVRQAELAAERALAGASGGAPAGPRPLSRAGVSR